MESIVPAGTDRQDEPCRRCADRDRLDRLDHGHVPADWGRPRQRLVEDTSGIVGEDECLCPSHWSSDRTPNPYCPMHGDQVHNHGPSEGRGIGCPEHLVDGQLLGACIERPGGAA